MKIHSTAAVVAALALVVALSGCSGESGDTPAAPATVTVTASPGTPDETAQATPTPSVDTQQTLTRYFEASATGDPADMRPMRRAAQKGSPADLYAIYLLAAVSAFGGLSRDAVSVSDNQVLVTSVNELTGEETTSIYENFEFDENGLLVTWSVEGAGPLEDRIQPLEGSISSGGVKMQLQAAYQTNAGDLAVTYRVTNKGSETASVLVTGYISPRGRQGKVEPTPFIMDPRPGAYMDGFLRITNGQPGGTLVVQVDYTTTQELVIE